MTKPTVTAVVLVANDTAGKSRAFEAEVKESLNGIHAVHQEARTTLF